MATIRNKSYRWEGGLTTVLSAKAATGAGTGVDVGQFRHVLVEISSDGGGNAALTVNCQGSVSDTEPTWGSAQSRTNMWDYISMNDLQSALIVSGDTGLVYSTADDYRLFMVNTDGLKWLNFRVTAYTAGNVTVKIKGFNNQ